MIGDQNYHNCYCMWAGPGPCPCPYNRQAFAAPMILPAGCICPPTSEQTCQNPICPRKGAIVYTSAP